MGFSKNNEKMLLMGAKMHKRFFFPRPQRVKLVSSWTIR
jgi:hypothetical protein